MVALDYAHVLLALGVPTFLLLQKFQAPYAKYSTSSTSRWWGPPIAARWAWFIQETPSLYCSLLAFLHYPSKGQTHASGNLLLFSLYLFHYVVRALVFPFLLSRGSKPTPLFVAFLSFAFCLGNGALQGHSLAHSTPPFSLAQMSAVQWAGVAVFFAGFALNQQADHILRSLRKDASDTRHYIPRGGLFRYVTGANYTGEMVEWFGWWMACQSWASFAFFVYTVANLAPRARSYHQWYKAKFDDYPRDRTAVIPFLY